MTSSCSCSKQTAVIWYRAFFKCVLMYLVPERDGERPILRLSSLMCLSGHPSSRGPLCSLFPGHELLISVVHSHWSRLGSHCALVESNAAPALLCQKEPARRIQSPLLHLVWWHCGICNWPDKSERQDSLYLHLLTCSDQRAMKKLS